MVNNKKSKKSKHAKSTYSKLDRDYINFFNDVLTQYNGGEVMISVPPHYVARAKVLNETLLPLMHNKVLDFTKEQVECFIMLEDDTLPNGGYEHPLFA
jgi:hypothetical protein